MRTFHQQWLFPVVAVVRLRNLTILVVGTCPVGLFALAELGPGGIIVNVSLRTEYDSNIFANNLELDDFIARLGTTASYEASDGLLHFNASIGARYSAYAEFDNSNSVDPQVALSLSGFHRDPAPDLMFSLAAGWREQTDANSEAGDQVSPETVNLDGSLDYRLSDKSGLGVSAGIASLDYDEARFTDSDDYRLSLSYIYFYSQKLQFPATVRYRIIDYGTFDFGTTTFSVGAEGVLSSKLSGFLNFGLSESDVGNDPVLYYAVGLNWAVDINTSLALSGTRDYEPSAFGAGSITTNLSLSLSQRLTDTLTGSLFAGFGQLEYNGSGTRQDDVLNGGGSLSLRVGDHASLSLSVSMETRGSDLAFAEYDRVQVTLGGGTRF